jgi:hypothetical protein
MGYRVQAMQWGHETSRDVVSRSPWQVCASGPQPPRCWASYGLLPHSHTRTYLCLVVAVQHTYLKILILCRSTTWELTLTTQLSPDTWRCACCGCLGTSCSTDPREIKCRGSWSPILGWSPTPLWMQSQSPRSVGVTLFWLRPTGVCSLACSRARPTRGFCSLIFSEFCSYYRLTFALLCSSIPRSRPGGRTPTSAGRSMPWQTTTSFGRHTSMSSS